MTSAELHPDLFERYLILLRTGHFLSGLSSQEEYNPMAEQSQVKVFIKELLCDLRIQTVRALIL